MSCPVAQLTLSHPELLVAVEMLSSVVLMNQAMEAGDRAALWRQLSSPVTGLSNVEESYAQRSAHVRCLAVHILGGGGGFMCVCPSAGTWTSCCASGPQPETTAATI